MKEKTKMKYIPVSITSQPQHQTNYWPSPSAYVSLPNYMHKLSQISYANMQKTKPMSQSKQKRTLTLRKNRKQFLVNAEVLRLPQKYGIAFYLNR